MRHGIAHSSSLSSNGNASPLLRVQRLSQASKANNGIDRCAAMVRDMAAGGAFRGSVYGPIATELKMRPDAPAHAAAALENSLGAKNLSAFVCENDADGDLLRKCAFLPPWTFLLR
jgi:hypothetical protein